MKKLTEKEKTLLLEYAKWYDSYHSSPEQLVSEFEEERDTPVTKDKHIKKSFSMEH